MRPAGAGRSTSGLSPELRPVVVVQRADVVEGAARGAEARVDLVQLGGVERRAEALQAVAVVEAELRRMGFTIGRTIEDARLSDLLCVRSGGFDGVSRGVGRRSGF